MKPNLPDGWYKSREKAITRIGYSLEEWMEELAQDAVQGYTDSAQFKEDACEYCRDMGWKEPT